MTGYLVKAKGLYYYKCRVTGCKHNVSAKKVHEVFAKLISIFQIDKVDKPLIEGTVTTYYDSFFEEQLENERLIKKQITEVRKNIETIEERFVLGEIDQKLYNKFMKKYKAKLSEIENNNPNDQKSSSNLQNCLNEVMKFCLKPKKWWDSVSIHTKLKIQNIIFPDGITINQQDGTVRTSRINSMFVPILELARVLAKKKNGQPVKNNQLSVIVGDVGLIS